MTTQVGKTGNDERGLLPYPVIIAATKGEPQAMNIIFARSGFCLYAMFARECHALSLYPIEPLYVIYRLRLAVYQPKC